MWIWRILWCKFSFFCLFCFLFGCGCGGLGFLTTVEKAFWVGFCVWGFFWGLFGFGCGGFVVGFWLFGCVLLLVVGVLMFGGCFFVFGCQVWVLEMFLVWLCDSLFEPGWRSGYRAGLEIQAAQVGPVLLTSQPVGLWLAGVRVPSPAPPTYFWTNPPRSDPFGLRKILPLFFLMLAPTKIHDSVPRTAVTSLPALSLEWIKTEYA